MDGHIDDYDEVLPHVFLGDVHRYVADTLNGDDDASASDVQAKASSTFWRTASGEAKTPSEN